MRSFFMVFSILCSFSLFAYEIKNISRDAAIVCNGTFDLGDGTKEYQFEVAIVGEKGDDGNNFPIYVFANGKRNFQLDDFGSLFKQNKNLVFQIDFDVTTPVRTLVIQNGSDIDFKQRDLHHHVYSRPGYFVYYGKSHAVNCEMYAK